MGSDYKKQFNLTIAGSNNANCPTTKYIAASGSQASSAVAGGSTVSDEQLKKFSYDNVRFNLNFPEQVKAYENFFVEIEVNNTLTDKKEFSIWSYIYKGRTVLMEQKENMVNISLMPHDSAKLKLKNKITNKEIPVGDYKIMVKISSPNLKSIRSVSSPIDLIYPTNHQIAIIAEFKQGKQHDNIVELESRIISSESITAELVLESIKGAQKKAIEISAKKETKASFKEEAVDGKNIFLLKLMQGNDILDIKELVVSLNSTKTSYQKDLFFSNLERASNLDLITGKAILDNQQKTVYLSSSEKARELAALFIVVLLAYLVILLVWKKL